MPSGRIHAQDSLLVAAGVMVATAWHGGDLVQVAPVALGSVAGLFLSPDLDHDSKTRSELILIRNVPVLGHLFFMYWYPYAVLIKHRSPLSHAPVVGTVFRLVYCLLLPLSMRMAIPIAMGQGVQTDVLIHLLADLSGVWTWPWREVMIGLAMSDTVHWLRDMTMSGGQNES